LEFIETIYESLIESAAHFMVSYIDSETGLPKPSYDLWEERHGTTTFTTGAVYAGLKSAANFADILGKMEEKELYNKTAERVKDALIKFLYTEEDAFCRMINRQHTKVVYDRTTDISSFYALFAFNVLDINDPKMEHMKNVIEERLILKTEIGGVARYVDDYYYRIDQNTPGNPWFITTLWLAQYYIKKAQTERDFAPVKHWLQWCVRYSLDSGVMPEQIHPHTGLSVAATPLTWSHAEFVETIIQYLEKVKELKISQKE
jgi:GH15 family glucan-1,4-alpha-glucosidase